MKILNPKDASASTPDVQGVSPDNKPHSVSIDASNVAEFATPESEMTDYDKAVVKSFEEAAEESRKEANLRAKENKAAVEAASSVDIGAHTKKDPLLKSLPGSGSAENKVSVSAEHKNNFCTALITNSRYEENFTLFGGRVKATIRSRTLGETDAIEAYLRNQVATGALVTNADYGNMVRKIMLAAQVKEVNGVRYDELKGPLFATEIEDGRTEPGWVKQLEIWDRQSNALAVALIRCVVEFEARYWFMVENSQDTNFWNRGESTAE